MLKTNAEFIAMLDDDEWPEAGWLDAYLHTQAETQADALHGAVIPVFEARPRASVAECDGKASQRGTTGLCDMICSTANVFLTRACFEDMPKPCFDPAFGLSGGEDRDFFTRLKAQRRALSLMRTKRWCALTYPPRARRWPGRSSAPIASAIPTCGCS